VAQEGMAAVGPEMKHWRNSAAPRLDEKQKQEFRLTYVSSNDTLIL
jgi:hypothetical protein